MMQQCKTYQRHTGSGHLKPAVPCQAPVVSRLFKRQFPTQQSRCVECKAKYETVADIMEHDRPIFTCSPEDSIEKALEILVEQQISGLPVVDDDNIVVGVVSDWDLLALASYGRSNNSLFPSTDDTWRAFKDLQKAVAKGTGKKVKDVMTKSTMTVRPNTNIDDATKMLLKQRIRRLPVVDDQGRLIGLLSRANVIRVALDYARQLQSM